MKHTKVTLFSLAMVAFLVACQNNTPKKEYFIRLNDVENATMVTSNVKQYIDDMKKQEVQYKAEGGDIYKIWDLYGEDGIDIDEGSKKDEDRVYLDTGEVNGKNQTVRNSTPDRSDKNTGVDLVFNVVEGHEAEQYKVLVSDNENFENAKAYVTKDTSVNVKNLLMNTKYYWKVEGNNEESDVGTFTTGDYVRWISARPLFNVRDNGGFMTDSGKRVKQGLIYRGGEITIKTWGDHALTATEESKAIFREDMGMVGGLEIDLRGTGDIGDGYKANAFAEDGDIAYEMLAIKSYNETFSKDGTGATNPTKARETVAKIFEHIKEADKKPIYYHCYGGADRTGTLGFLINGLLGVSYSDLVIDFELTSYSSINNEHIRSHLRDHQYDHWRNLINFVKTDTTNGYAYDENAPLKDNIYNLLNLGCKIPAETLDTIRDIMIEK